MARTREDRWHNFRVDFEPDDGSIKYQITCNTTLTLYPVATKNKKERVTLDIDQLPEDTKQLVLLCLIAPENGVGVRVDWRDTTCDVSRVTAGEKGEWYNMPFDEKQTLIGIIQP